MGKNGVGKIASCNTMNLNIEIAYQMNNIPLIVIRTVSEKIKTCLII